MSSPAETSAKTCLSLTNATLPARVLVSIARINMDKHSIANRDTPGGNDGALNNCKTGVKLWSNLNTNHEAKFILTC